ncbi:hypothetical protein H7I76_09185, partial [Mycolicibacterium vaccae]|nr:hypothetical protein [Mycolicibacterium vaccae]
MDHVPLARLEAQLFLERDCRVLVLGFFRGRLGDIVIGTFSGGRGVSMWTPASICSSEVNSRSLWEMPSTLGTKSITVGTTSFRFTE